MNPKENLIESNQVRHIHTKIYKTISNSTQKEMNILPKLKIPVHKNSIFYGSDSEPSRDNMYENSILGIESDFYYNGETLINKSSSLLRLTHQDEQIHDIQHKIDKSSDKIKVFLTKNIKWAYPKAAEKVAIADSDCVEVKEITADTTMNEIVVIDSDNETSKEINEMGNEQTMYRKKKLHRPGPTKIIEGNQTLYLCNVCRRCYKHRSSFSMHHRTECLHQPIFKCRQCSFRANDKISLLVHVNNTHKKTYSQEISNFSNDYWKSCRQYYCAYCGQNFLSSRLRFIHMLKHCCKNKPSLKNPTNFSVLTETKSYALEKRNQQKANSENNIQPILKQMESSYSDVTRISVSNSLKKDLENSWFRTRAVAVVQPLHAPNDHYQQTEPQPVALVYTKTLTK